MQEIPPPQIVTPTWLGLFVMVAAGLAFVAFVVVTSVLLGAGVSLISSRRIRSLSAMMLFIVPALAVVGMIGMKWGAARMNAVHGVEWAQHSPDIQTVAGDQAR